MIQSKNRQEELLPERIEIPGLGYVQQLSNKGNYWLHTYDDGAVYCIKGPMFGKLRVREIADALNTRPSIPAGAEALATMPDVVGTPGTGAYQRSLEAVLRWYDTNYKTLRQALASQAPSVGQGVDLVACYVGLLQLPQSKWRTENQPLYASLRDAVAKHVGMSPEHTQNSCEEVAATLSPQPLTERNGAAEEQLFKLNVVMSKHDCDEYQVKAVIDFVRPILNAKRKAVETAVAEKCGPLLKKLAELGYVEENETAS